MIKICCVSDTHGQHLKLKIPKCDLFIFAGDANIRSLNDLHNFNDWLGTIEVNYGRICIAGNHDIELEDIGQAWCEHLFTNAIYLQDKMVTINGLKIYGSPWTPLFMSWAFMKPRGCLELRKIWKKIPQDLDIFVSHGMPYNILDYTSFEKKHVGCNILQKELLVKKPKIALGGHLHENGNQSIDKAGIKFYNCSVLDEKYQLVNAPTIIEF